MIDLSTGSATNILGGVVHVENITGGSGDDQLTGDDLANVIQGNAGNDSMSGLAGDDSMFGMPATTT